MKTIYLLSLFAFSSLIASDSEEEAQVELTSSLEPLENPTLFSSDQGEAFSFEPLPSFEQTASTSKLYMISYGQLEMVLPGAGLGVRTRTKYVGLELDASVIYGALKVSGSGLLRLSNQPDQGIYLGAGIGASLIYGLDYAAYIPLFIGYEGKRYFADIGFDSIFYPEYILFPIPIARFGVRF